MDTNDVLRSRFDAIDAVAVDEMIARKTPEGLQLDFKRFNESSGLGSPGDIKGADANRKNVKKCLSGFANSAGGIILWGVTTEDSELGGTNVACGKIPIQQGAIAKKLLDDLSLNATHPPVDGVLNELISLSEGGHLIKTLVPQSERTPHRTSDLDGQYYRRGADRFDAMWHHEIEAMFGRRSRPRLRLETPAFVRIKFSHVFMLLAIRNEGRGSARFPVLRLELKEGNYLPFDISTMPGVMQRYGFSLQPGGPRSRMTDPLVYAAGMDVAIHPGQVVPAAALAVQNGQYLVSCGNLEIAHTIFAEGLEPVDDVIKITSEEIYKNVRDIS